MSVVESLLAAGQGVVHLNENISAVATVRFYILSLSLSLSLLRQESLQKERACISVYNARPSLQCEVLTTIK